MKPITMKPITMTLSSKIRRQVSFGATSIGQARRQGRMLIEQAFGGVGELKITDKNGLLIREGRTQAGESWCVFETNYSKEKALAAYAVGK